VIPQHVLLHAQRELAAIPYLCFHRSSAVCSDACRHRRSSRVVAY